MKKEEREQYRKKMNRYEKLGALKFQKVVFGVEKAKFKILKKLCPNFIKHFDKYCDFKKNRALKKAKTEQEAKKIIRDVKYAKIAMRKEFQQEKNRNYHMDPNNPTEIYRYLEWNKQIHKNGIIKDAIIIPILIGGVAFGIPGALPILIYELISAGINFECINIQNYNICRYKMIEDSITRKEPTRIKKNIEEYGEISKVIHTTVEEKDHVATIDEIIDNIKNPEQLRQFKKLLQKERQERAIETNRGNKK